MKKNKYAKNIQACSLYNNNDLKAQVKLNVKQCNTKGLIVTILPQEVRKCDNSAQYISEQKQRNINHFVFVLVQRTS